MKRFFKYMCLVPSLASLEAADVLKASDDLSFLTKAETYFDAQMQERDVYEVDEQGIKTISSKISWDFLTSGIEEIRLHENGVLSAKHSDGRRFYLIDLSEIDPRWGQKIDHSKFELASSRTQSEGVLKAKL